VKEIVSRNNPEFRKFLRVLRGQGIRKHDAAILSGPKQIREVLRAFPERCAGIILREHQEVPGGIIPPGTRIYRLSPGLFREIDLYGTDQPVLLMRAGPFPMWNPENWPPGCTLFVPFQDPVNVGAVIRSAAAFRVARVIMLKESAHPFHHKSSRVAGSTLLRIPIQEGPSLGDLGSLKFPLLTLSPGGQDIGAYRFPPTFGLLPGLEGPGLPSGLKGLTALGIPMASGVESLNAALATGIALYVWRSGL
jgi:tRNA G18 (ribose-2'-O)-methylase SpoU